MSALKIFGRLLLVLVGVIVSTLVVLYFVNKKHVDAFQHLPSAYYAKEFCTCAFVIGQDEKFCHDYARIDFPRQLADPRGGFTWDPAQKSVTVLAMGQQSTAKWVDARRGCVIE